MFGGWSASGLRMRFRPASRICQSFMTVSPWLDVILVVLLFVFVSGELLVSPGMPVKLPEGPFVEGVRHGVPMVLVAVEKDDGVSCLIFFDEDRYRLGDNDRELAFAQAVESYVSRSGVAKAVLHADERVPHGMVVRAVNLARSAGIRLVNITVRPE